ncbi:ABC-type transport auxiliary lipoprotein family protein [uncultured Limimaricola sp.]|uniref:ABC-type transport auxiliary lipoprotein family protein n=1 Tax=uncultured Limimaricola sp. TaxID=2211667 RepID=UPI0030F983FF
MELPEAGGASATGCVMIRPTPMRGQSLPDARWADPLPEAAQTLMVRTLSDTNALRFVGRKPLGVGGDFAVLAVLIDFQAGATGPGAVINLRMDVRLVRERDATVISLRTITAKPRAATAEGDDVVAAFDQTTGQPMQAFAAWLLGSVSGQS